MACNSCGSGGGGCGKPDGCGSGGCSTGGCNRLNVFDWLQDIQLPFGQRPFDVIEVRFKGTRKEFYQNYHHLELYPGEPVVVESGTGRAYDVGVVSMRGETVKLQLKKKRVADDTVFSRVIRAATPADLERWDDARARETDLLTGGRNLIEDLRLDMKLSDVEMQGDGSRATFYYSAEDRVDFRQLLRELSNRFGLQVNMRQITLRQEAGRIGGIGSCGRELCCSTWLTDFKQVTTSAARYQNLALNSAKLSGQCGRLKCCLNYELDVYLDALKQYPKNADKLETEAGRAVLAKTDIFRRAMVYYVKATGQFFTLPPERAAFIANENAEGRKPSALDDARIPIPMALQAEQDAVPEIEIVFEDAEGEGSLNRFERSRRRTGGNARNGKNTPREGSQTRSSDRPRSERSPSDRNTADRNTADRPRGERADRSDRNAPRTEQKTRGERSGSDKPRGERSGENKPRGERSGENKPRVDRPLREAKSAYTPEREVPPRPPAE